MSLYPVLHWSNLMAFRPELAFIHGLRLKVKRASACSISCSHCPHHLPVSLLIPSFFSHSLFLFHFFWEAGTYNTEWQLSTINTGAHTEGWFTKGTGSLRKLHTASPPSSTLQAVIFSALHLTEQQQKCSFCQKNKCYWRTLSRCWDVLPLCVPMHPALLTQIHFNGSLFLLVLHNQLSCSSSGSYFNINKTHSWLMTGMRNQASPWVLQLRCLTGSLPTTPASALTSPARGTLGICWVPWHGRTFVDRQMSYPQCHWQVLKPQLP